MLRWNQGKQLSTFCSDQIPRALTLLYPFILQSISFVDPISIVSLRNTPNSRTNISCQQPFRPAFGSSPYQVPYCLRQTSSRYELPKLMTSTLDYLLKWLPFQFKLIHIIFVKIRTPCQFRTILLSVPSEQYARLCSMYDT